MTICELPVVIRFACFDGGVGRSRAPARFALARDRQAPIDRLPQPAARVQTGWNLESPVRTSAWRIPSRWNMASGWNPRCLGDPAGAADAPLVRGRQPNSVQRRESGTFAVFRNNLSRLRCPIAWESNVPWESGAAECDPPTTHHPCSDSFSCLTDGVHSIEKTVSRETRGGFPCGIKCLTGLMT
jgi:hypothetical protein